MNIFDYGNEANTYNIPSMSEGNFNLGGSQDILWNGGPYDGEAASTNAIPTPPSSWGMPDVSGFANYGMTPPGLQSIPYAQTMGGQLPPTPQPLGLMNAGATAEIPKLRNEDKINLLGIFGAGQPNKRKVDVPQGGLMAYLSSLGASNNG